LASLKREAQAVAKLSHPNIVQIYDIDEAGGYHFFSMEYVDGESLGDRLAAKGRLPVGEAVRIVAEAAAALDFAYERLVLHRDIKPPNILLTERGEVKVADIGLSKSLEDTPVGIVRSSLGAALYMAPEFARNPRLADCRSDIYALGGVLFHALTGRPPFPGSDLAELVLKHADASFPSARALAPDVPQGLDAILKRMCAKDPAERFQSYDELLDAMQELLKSTDFRRPQSAPPTTERRAKRPAWLPVAAGLAAAAAVAAGLLVFLLPRLRGGGSQAVAPVTSTAPGPRKPTPPPPKPIPPKKTPEPETKEAVEPPKPKTDTPVEPKKQEPEPKKEEPTEGPKKGDGPAWEAKLADAKRAADAFAAKNEFGKAIAALDEAMKDDEDAALKKAADEARAALKAQAAKAFEGVVNAVRGLAAAGKLDEARAALLAVVETFGTDDEVGQAKVAADAVGQYLAARAALTKGAEEARTAAEAAARRSAQQADIAKALQSVQPHLDAWRLEEAAEALGKMKFDDPATAAAVEQRKAAVEALAAFRDAVSQHFKAAQPRIRKVELRIPGRNGELTGGDREGLTALVAEGETDKTPWPKLNEAALERIVKLKGLVKADDPAHQLALGLWWHLLGDAQKAAAAFGRAADLGAKASTLTEAPQPPEKATKETEAARALGDALKLCLDGEFNDAKKALAAYKEKFADTDFYSAQERVYDVASAFKPYSPPTIVQPEPTPPVKEPEPKQKEPEPKQKEPEPKRKEPEPKAQPGDEKKAKECYDKAVAAYNVRALDECKKQLDALRQASPGSPLLADAKLNPTVAAMQGAVNARGQAIKLSAGGKGALPTLDKALAAIEKPNATIEVEAGVYPRASAAIPAAKAQGLILRGVGKERPRLDGGIAKRETILQFAKNAKDLWLGNLEFANAKAAIDLDIDCALALHNCVAVNNVGSILSKHPVARVTIASSVLRLDKLVDTPTRYSAIQLADKAPVESSEIIGAILIGNDLAFRNVTLTDCVIIGDGVLGGNSKLNHVTATGPLTVSDDARGVNIANSILAAIAVNDPRAKGKAKDKKQPELMATVAHTAFYAQAKPIPRELVKTEHLERVSRPPFEDPRGHNYRLPRDSSLRGKASDKSDLGCRFPPDTLELLRTVARYPQVLKVPPPAGK
ncbi:MAG: hypothetical protein FJ291_11105, partial [Planctomycetes bacterium]|nr:hypothetical protein [Planctomycetota bacterium]